MTKSNVAALPSIGHRIATELGVKPAQVAAAVALLDEGATVPFIARYRKEATGGLDDVQLRTLEERLGYLRELEERRAAILESIREQGKLTPELEAGITAADTKQRLEDLYAPYKPKRRTKAQMAREAGLDVLAHALLADPTLDPEVEAAKYLKPAFESEHGANPGVPDVKAALDGVDAVILAFGLPKTAAALLRPFVAVVARHRAPDVRPAMQPGFRLLRQHPAQSGRVALELEEVERDQGRDEGEEPEDGVPGHLTSPLRRRYSRTRRSKGSAVDAKTWWMPRAEQ